MKELAVLKESTMTSREIAEITGKTHDKILRDIRDEISKIGIERGQTIFGESYYINEQNKRQPMYNLTKEGVLQLAARYDAVVRFKLIERATKPKQLTKIEALQMALETELENERLRIENEAQKEIIKGLNGDLQPYQIEDIINRVVRVGGGNYGNRYNEIYRVFKEQYHIDLKARMNNYNKTVRPKNRFKSVLSYAIANDYGKDLLKVVTRLYPESVRVIMDGINQNTGLGNNEVLLLSWYESESFRRRIFPHKWRKWKNILLIKLLGGKNPLSYDWNTQYSPKKLI